MPRALLRDPSRGSWLAFDTPRTEYAVNDLASLPGVVQSVCEVVETHGSWAVCMLSYESAPAFDAAYRVRPAGEFPLAWFGLFDPPEFLKSPPPGRSRELPVDPQWLPSLNASSYTDRIHRIRALISRGDTYQVNFTFRLRRAFGADPYQLFYALASQAPPPFAAYLEFGSHAICSLSPELFFRLQGDLLTSRPMKGTSPRGLSADDDLLAADRLRRSPKNRAENIMIVDMVRNDLGRVARQGTVAATRMYDIEQYPTVWQMTSTVEARTDASVPEILTALFPPSSITGAPKIRTMEIIRDLEESPRHVYTGAIGWIAPGRTAQFSVAIRTLMIDRAANEAEYGVGGGIVWDSDPGEEYQECLTKAAILDRRPADFALLETMLWTARDGLGLLNDHLARLQSSARFFGFSYDEALIRQRLAETLQATGDLDTADSFGRTRGMKRAGRAGSPSTPDAAHAPAASPRKVRLTLAPDGTVAIETSPLRPLRIDGPPRVKLAAGPIDVRDPFLYHKTTNRRVYERALQTAGDCDDVILWNERGEITESCIANVVVDIGGTLFTPPVASGLLPGVSRARLLRDGTVRERFILVDDFLKANRIILTNAVRGNYEVRRGG